MERKVLGRPIIHKDITVSQNDNYREYHKQYYHKVLKLKKVEKSIKIEGEE